MSVSNLLSMDEVKSATSKLTKASYIQRTPDKSVNGPEFENGDITYSFNVSGNSWWVPSKSYFSIRCRLGKNGAYDQPNLADQVAPSPMFVSGLFDSVDFRIENNSVSRIGSRLPQVWATRNRLTRSNAWRETIGRQTFMDPSFENRQQLIAADAGTVDKAGLGFTGTASTATLEMDTAGNITVAVAAGGTAPDLTATFVVGDAITITIGDNTLNFTVNSVTDATHMVVGDGCTTVAIVATAAFAITRTRAGGEAGRNFVEVPFQLPLGIFDVDRPMPPGNYSFVFSPNTNKKGVSSLQTPEGVANTVADIEVRNMFLYLNIVEGETPPRDYTHYLDLQEVRCQQQALQSSTGEQQLDYIVSPSTYALTMAFQQQAAGSSTQYPPQLFKLQDSEHLSMNRFRLQYANQTQPKPDGDPEYASNRDWLAKTYNDTMMMSNLAFAPGGCEKYEDWKTGYGPLFHYMFLKPAGDTDTAATIAVTMNTQPTSGNMLLFDWSSSVSQIQYRDGRVISVQTENA